MQICIAGWYYFEDCIKPFSLCDNVYIVGHRSGNCFNIPCVIIENIGLEFHCYDYFVKNIWNKKSDVLFCHDDIIIKNISFLEDLEKIDGSVVMVWNDENHYKKNLAHGRMFKCNAQYLITTNGFWWDKNNKGSLCHSQGCNNGIEKFYQNTKKILKHYFTDKVIMGLRGKI